MLIVNVKYQDFYLLFGLQNYDLKGFQFWWKNWHKQNADSKIW